MEIVGDDRPCVTPEKALFFFNFSDSSVITLNGVYKSFEFEFEC